MSSRGVLKAVDDAVCSKNRFALKMNQLIGIVFVKTMGLF